MFAVAESVAPRKEASRKSGSVAVPRTFFSRGYFASSKAEPSHRSHPKGNEPTKARISPVIAFEGLGNICGSILFIRLVIQFNF